MEVIQAPISLGTCQVLARLPDGTSHAVDCDPGCSAQDFSLVLQDRFGLPPCIYLHDGVHVFTKEDILLSGRAHGIVQVCLPLNGGKGGYGNQLRALGRKGGITDNTGDCRDLSGRRLRDVIASQEAEEWKAKQKERDAQKAFDKAQENLEKQQRKEEEQKEIEDKVLQVVKRSNADVNSSVNKGIGEVSKVVAEQKRKLEQRSTLAKKRAKVFGLEEESSSDDGDDDSEEEAS